MEAALSGAVVEAVGSEAEDDESEDEGESDPTCTSASACAAAAAIAAAAAKSVRSAAALVSEMGPRGMAASVDSIRRAAASKASSVVTALAGEAATLAGGRWLRMRACASST